MIENNFDSYIGSESLFPFFSTWNTSEIGEISDLPCVGVLQKKNLLVTLSLHILLNAL